MSEDNGGYWNTLAGITARISDVAHNFSWASLGEAIKGIFVSEPTAKYLVWKTADDDNVCDLCTDGEGMSFTEDDAMLPDLPIHVDCRCWMELELGKEDDN